MSDDLNISPFTRRRGGSTFTLLGDTHNKRCVSPLTIEIPKTLFLTFTKSVQATKYSQRARKNGSQPKHIVPCDKQKKPMIAFRTHPGRQWQRERLRKCYNLRTFRNLFEETFQYYLPAYPQLFEAVLPSRYSSWNVWITLPTHPCSVCSNLQTLLDLSYQYIKITRYGVE